MITTDRTRVLKLIFALLLCLRPALARAAVCDESLDGPVADRMQLAPERVAQNLNQYLTQYGFEATTSKSLLNWAEIYPERHSHIVLLNLSRFLGDNMIFYFSLIAYLRQTYRKVPLTVVSPTADVFAEASGNAFQTVRFPVTFSQHRKLEDRVSSIWDMRVHFNEFIPKHIPPKAFVLYDLTTLDKADDEYRRIHPEELPPSRHLRAWLQRVGATGVGLSTLKGERIFHGLMAVEIISPNLRADLGAGEYSQAIKTRLEDVNVFGLRGPTKFSESTTYGSWLENVSLLFGPETYLSWHAQYYSPPGRKTRADELLRAQGVNPEAEYALINLNTWGGDKVRDLRPVYSEILRRLSAAILARRPNLNLLVRFPETQFGPEVQSEVLELASAYPGRIALVASSALDLVPHYLEHARWVMSYDSGLTHLAAFLPKERVLTLGLHSSGAELWRKPGQTYIKLSKGEGIDRLIREALAWTEAQPDK